MQKKSSKNFSRKSGKDYVLVLDVGTTGIKAFVFDGELNVISRVYRPLKKYFPRNGWVEQNPQDFLKISKEALRAAVHKSGILGNAFRGLSITNQRETTILWDKKTGTPIYSAIVWEDARTATICRQLQNKFGVLVQSKTGLPVDPYFSASKIQWIIKNTKSAKELLAERRLLFGTIDTWIMWNFLDNSPHISDCTNASRTLLFNIRNLDWDQELLNVFEIPKEILPEVKPSQSVFGVLKSDILGFTLPVLGVCGDQQASLFAAGMEIGTTKVTYGTGTFITQVLGPQFKLHPPFFTTLAPFSKQPIYALETKINNTGKRVQLVLHKTKELRVLVEKITGKVGEYIKKVPIRPRELVIDGGITKYKNLLALQTKASSLVVKKQKIYDGTALGAAMLTKKQT